ncbi:hypothetical protein [Streptomyces sp. NPDC005408]|uniref:hypothetical protein n=1 Tax=Streptomyces sp. NPDC005408 TaxID=3155341 RepID=UPI0033A40D47
MTVPVREVALPDPDDAPVPFALPEGQEDCPQRMAAGCFAFDPAPLQAHRIVPVSEWEPVVIPAYTKVQGVLANQGDLRDLVHSSVRGRLNGCCGLDGCDGPNLVCRFCTAELAVERSDCWTPQEVVLLAGAVEFALAPASTEPGAW